MTQISNLKNYIAKSQKIISFYQIIGGIMGWLLILFLTLNTTFFFSITTISLFLIFSFSIVCGYLVLVKHRLGLLLTNINQIFQVFSFSIFGLTYKYIAGISIEISLKITQIQFGINASLSNFHIIYNQNADVIAIHINLVALYILYLVSKIQEKQADLELLENESGDK
jgi:hypothetical protein